MKHKYAIKEAYAKGYRVNEKGEVIAPSGKVRKLATKVYKGVKYKTFTVKSQKISYPIKVHRLAAFQIYGEFSIDAIGRHLDGNSLNNDPSNIAIGSVSDNALDREPLARLEHALKAARNRRKLTEGQVRCIRNSSKSLRDLALEYGVTKSTISTVKSRRFYRWVE